jgi:hypothetical protein
MFARLKHAHMQSEISKQSLQAVGIDSGHRAVAISEPQATKHLNAPNNQTMYPRGNYTCRDRQKLIWS